MNKKEIFKLAKFMHDRYEILAKQENWKTNELSRCSFEYLPLANKRVMLRLAEEILERFF